MLAGRCFVIADPDDPGIAVAKFFDVASIIGDVVRGSVGRFGVESEQKVQHAQIERNGRRVLTDSAARWLGVLHLSAHDSLRAVWQASRYRREADSVVGIPAARVDARSVSLVFQHRVGLGRNLSVGATRARSDPGGLRNDEVFVKVAFVL